MIFATMFVPAPVNPKPNPAKSKGEATPAVINVAIPPPIVQIPPIIPKTVPSRCAMLCFAHTSSSLSAASFKLLTAFFTLAGTFSAFLLIVFTSSLACRISSSVRSLVTQTSSSRWMSPIVRLSVVSADEVKIKVRQFKSLIEFFYYQDCREWKTKRK